MSYDPNKNSFWYIFHIYTYVHIRFGYSVGRKKAEYELKIT